MGEEEESYTFTTPEEIEKYLKKEKEKFERLQIEPKLLLLGSSDSGKSTLLKQLKILHGNGFSKEERELSKRRITAGIFNIINVLLSRMNSEEYEEIPKIYNSFLVNCDAWQLGEKEAISLEQIRTYFTSFWKEPLVEKVFSTENHGLPDTTRYFASNIDRIFKEGYEPNDQDILNLRTVTQNISETIFNIPLPGGDTEKLHVIDVSGLIHHRSRWISYFDDVRCVVFVASLSCYDQNMIEEPDVNRMVDSLVLFEDMANHKLLEKKGDPALPFANSNKIVLRFVLFLNKKDVYEEKVKTKHIVDYFPQYKSPKGSASSGIMYFDGKFRDRNKIQKVITTHITCCTDTMIMKVVVFSVLNAILTSNMSLAGL